MYGGTLHGPQGRVRGSRSGDRPAPRWVARIIMSGGHDMYGPLPLRAKATAMARSLSRSVCPKRTSPSSSVGGTIGNFWFTKPLLRERGWCCAILVTSGGTWPRVRYLTQTIWGPATWWPSSR
jgi:hypothetical protein